MGWRTGLNEASWEGEPEIIVESELIWEEIMEEGWEREEVEGGME